MPGAVFILAKEEYALTCIANYVKTYKHKWKIFNKEQTITGNFTLPGAVDDLTSQEGVIFLKDRPLSQDEMGQPFPWQGENEEHCSKIFLPPLLNL